jgi:hypothetical protein
MNQERHKGKICFNKYDSLQPYVAGEIGTVMPGGFWQIAYMLADSYNCTMMIFAGTAKTCR